MTDGQVDISRYGHTEPVPVLSVDGMWFSRHRPRTLSLSLKTPVSHDPSTEQREACWEG